jgi:hypothetical protein
MPRKDAAASSHVCPGIRIHIIDMVEPLDIIISLMEKLSSESGEKKRKQNAETQRKTERRRS